MLSFWRCGPSVASLARSSVRVDSLAGPRKRSRGEDTKMRKLFAFGVTLAIAATLVGCGKKSEGSSGGGGGGSGSNGGSSHEKVVQDFCSAAQKFCSAVQSCDEEVLDELSFSNEMEDDGILFSFRSRSDISERKDFGAKGTNVLSKVAQKSDYGNRRNGDVESDPPPVRSKKTMSARGAFVAIARSKDPAKTKVLTSANIKGEEGSIVEATSGDATLYFFVHSKKDKEAKIAAVTTDKEMVDKAVRQVEAFKNGDDSGYEAYKGESQKSVCILNMKQMQTAGESWKSRIENCTKTPTLDDLCGPEDTKYIRQTPTCPSGGRYRIRTNEESGAIDVFCSEHGSLEKLMALEEEIAAERKGARKVYRAEKAMKAAAKPAAPMKYYEKEAKASDGYYKATKDADYARPARMSYAVTNAPAASAPATSKRYYDVPAAK